MFKIIDDGFLKQGQMQHGYSQSLVNILYITISGDVSIGHLFYSVVNLKIHVMTTALFLYHSVWSFNMDTCTFE